MACDQIQKLESHTDTDTQVEEEMKQDHFQRLPDDVVMFIINKLIHMKTLIRFSLVSKRYFSLVPQTDSLFVDLYTPPPTFLGRLGGFLGNLIAKFRRAPAPNVPIPINQKISAIKHGFKQLKHLHIHYGVKPSILLSGFHIWVASDGSNSVFLMASSVNQSISNPSVAAATTPNYYDMLSNYDIGEEPEFFLDLVKMLSAHLQVGNGLIKEVVPDCKMLETVVLTNDKNSGGNFIVGKKEIARLLEVSDSDPSELLACLLHVPTLELPESGYTMNDVMIALAYPVDQDREFVDSDQEDEKIESAVLDGSIWDRWKVFDDALRRISNGDIDNTNTMYASYIPYQTLQED